MAAWKIATFAAEVRRAEVPKTPAEEAAEAAMALYRLGRALLRAGWWLLGPSPSSPVRPSPCPAPATPLQSPFLWRVNAYGEGRPDSMWEPHQ